MVINSVGKRPAAAQCCCRILMELAGRVNGYAVDSLIEEFQYPIVFRCRVGHNVYAVPIGKGRIMRARRGVFTKLKPTGKRWVFNLIDAEILFVLKTGYLAIFKYVLFGSVAYFNGYLPMS